MNRIKELRVACGLTQTQLAEKIGLNQTAIGKYEREQLEPSLNTLKSLSALFECSIDYLIGHSDDFGNVTVYQQTDGVHSLSADEQKIIDALRRNAPNCPVEWNTLYAELPDYMQATIFAELKGMHLGYVTSKTKAKKIN